MNRRQFFATSAAAAASACLPPETAEERMARRVEYWMQLAAEAGRRAELTTLVYGPLPDGPASHIFPASFLRASVDA